MKFKVDQKKQKIPKVVISFVDKAGVSYKLQELVWKAAKKFDKGLKMEDVHIEHPDNPEHGDYATNIALQLASQKIKGNFLENIERFWKDISRENFHRKKFELPVGSLRKEMAEMIGAKNKIVWLREITFAKIRGWREKEGFEAHPEIDKRYFRAIPLVLSYPEHVIKHSSEKGRYLFVGQLGKQFALVIEVGTDGGRNWLVTAFMTRERYLKKREKDCLKHKKMGYPAGTAFPPILAPAKRGGGSRFSTLQDTRTFYNTLEEKCQEEIVNYEIERSPMEWAREILPKILITKCKMPYFDRVEVAPPGFINFWLSKEFLLSALAEPVKQEEKYGSSKVGRGKTVVIDYSSPNIARPFGIGHLRSTIIGQALYDIYNFLGWKTIGDNHIGDWGTQFGKLIVAIKKWSKKKAFDLNVKELEELYVKFHKEVEKDPKLGDEARAWFRKLEEGDPEARKIWEVCVKTSISEFDRIYNLLGIKIDYAYGESFYEDKMDEVIADAQKREIAKRSKGALVIKVPGIKVPLMLLKSDGATTYHTRDLATIKYRIKTWNPDLYIYEVGADQTLHFRQVFGAAALLGYGTLDQFVHVAHGMIRWEGGRFKTREGKTIYLEEVLFQAIQKAQDLAQKAGIAKGLSKEVQEKVARGVGIGAVKYNDLRQTPEKDIIFDWDKVLSLEGNSGPYLQYTYARAKSVLRKRQSNKASKRQSKDLISAAFNEEETAILRIIYQFPEVVLEAAKNFAPNLICNFLFDLAQKFNTFYNKWPIIKAEKKKEREFRLLLTASISQVLKNGLTLLGIKTLEKM